VIKIEVYHGDITLLEVDGVVNAANNRLWMGGGVAGALKRAGGKGIETEAVSKGPIPVGEAAGKLYSITGISINGAVTVQDQDDAIDWTDITTIDTTLDGVLLYSDGLKWWTLASNLSH